MNRLPFDTAKLIEICRQNDVKKDFHSFLATNRTCSIQGHYPTAEGVSNGIRLSFLSQCSTLLALEK